MRQLLYVSSSAPRGTRADVDAILYQACVNNARDDVTGLLYTDGVRFLQVLEGDTAAVERTFERINRDPRHHAIVVLHDLQTEQREFGGWAMAHRRPDDCADAFDDRMAAALSHTTDAVRGTFEGLVAARRAN